MNYNKSIQMRFYTPNDFSEPLASRSFTPVCAILAYVRDKEVTENVTTVRHKLKISIPYKRVEPYSLIREDSDLRFVHNGLPFEIKALQTITNGMGQPTAFVFDLTHDQKAQAHGH